MRCEVGGRAQMLVLKTTDKTGRCIRDVDYPFGACRRFRSVYALFDLLEDRVRCGNLIKKGERLSVICADIETGEYKSAVMVL